jgi:hypothetical protein
VRLAKGGNLRAVELRRAPFFDSRSPWSQKQISCRRISGQNVRKSRRKRVATTNSTDPLEARPPGWFGSPPVLPS